MRRRDKIPLPAFPATAEPHVQYPVQQDVKETAETPEHVDVRPEVDLWRFRNVFIGFGSALVTLLMVVSDPGYGFITDMTYGGGVLIYIITLLSVVLLVGLLHMSRKALLDYVDLERLIERAVNDKQSGMVVIGISIVMLAVSIIIGSVVFGSVMIGR